MTKFLLYPTASLLYPTASLLYPTAILLYPTASVSRTPLFYWGLWRSKTLKYLNTLKYLKEGLRRLSLTAAASLCSPIGNRLSIFYHTPVPSSAGVVYVPQQESAEFLPAEGGASFERGVYTRKYNFPSIGGQMETAIAPSEGGYKRFLYRLGTFTLFSEKRRVEALRGRLACFWRILGFSAADFTLYRRNRLVMGMAGGLLRVRARTREGWGEMLEMYTLKKKEQI